jgi:aminomethyltransferase
MSETVASAGPLSRLPLHNLHVAHGAKLVPFAGYSMPVQYAAGVLKEHQHTRAAAGLFDVSHMGQTMLRPRSGRVEDAAQALERLVPADVLALPPVRSQNLIRLRTPGKLRPARGQSGVHGRLGLSMDQLSSGAVSPTH